MALASVCFLCQGLSTMPKCSTHSKGSAPSLQLQCQLNSVRLYTSLSALWAATITMPSTVYWTELLIISLESSTCVSVSFTVTGEPSANVELRSPAYLMSVLDVASSHSATKMRESESFCLGNNHVTMAHKGNPQRTETRQTLDRIHGEELRPKTLPFISTQGPHVLHQPENEGPNRGPRVLKPEVYGSCLYF